MQHNKKEQQNQENPVGRPPKAPEDRKTVQLKIWVTPAEATAIKQKAREEGFKHSGPFMSKSIRDAVHGATPIIKLDPVDMRNMSGIGNNLNQIAKHLNGGGGYHPEMHEDVLYASGLVKKLGQDLYRLIAKHKGRAVK